MKKIFTVTAIIFGSHLSAQDSTLLDNVVLTANKYSTKTTETGKVVVTITREELEKAGSRDLSQVLGELGGVFINGYTNNPGKEKNVYLRGAKVDHSLITVDGIPVYDASGIGSNFDIRYFPIDNIERIEILKGSQGTLYGSDAIAGVINIITKKGSTQPSFNAVAHYGSFNTLRYNLGVNGGKKNIRYNAGFSRISTDGFSEAEKPENVSQEFDKDGFKQNNVQASLEIDASDKLKFQPFVRYSWNSGDLDQDAFTDEKDFDYKAKNLQMGLRNSVKIRRTTLNLLYQYHHTNRSYLDDSSTVNGFYFYNQARYIAREHYAELFAVIPVQKFRITAGTDLRSSNTDFDAVMQTIFDPAPIPFSYSGDSIKQSQKSLYAAIHYQQNNFTIEAGGRFNHHSVYGNNQAFNINPSLLVNKKLKFFANVSSGYKVPSLYQLFSEYGNILLEPEKAINFEGGLQYILKDRRSAIRATVFKRDVNDVIAFFYDASTFQSRYINQDEQKDHGFEIDGKFYFGEKFQLKTLFSYVDGNIHTVQNGKDTSYFNLIRRPKTNLNLFMGMQLSKSFYVNLQLNVVGKSRDIYFDPITFQGTDMELDAYSLLNFYAEYTVLQNRLRIFADARNILDKKYADVYGYSTAGFNAYGGIRFSL